MRLLWKIFCPSLAICPGVLKKFADADLIGCPIRILVSEKSGEKIEVKRRNENETRLLVLSEVLSL